MPDSYASTNEGLLLIANGIDPVLRWDSYTATTEPAGVEPPDTAPSGAGSGTGTLTGTYTVYVRYVRRDGFASALSPVSGQFILNANAQIDYTGIPVSPDNRVARRQIFRNTNGQARTYYLDVDIADNVSTTATSTTSDTLLALNEAFPIFNSQNLLLTLDNLPPPDTKPVLAFSQNRCFAAGYQAYSEGSCEVTQGSTLITGRGTFWRANWAGRLIYIEGADATYEIASVSESAQTITLTTNYTGDTNLYAGYTIRPTSGECSLIYFSTLASPEAWPPTNAIAIPDEDDEVTGLMPLYGFLYILKRRSVYKFTAQNDPLADGYLFLNARRGCVNHRCWVVVDEHAFILDERGVHLFNGGQEPEDVSGPIQDLFRDGSETPINWAASRFFHAGHSPGESAIRFFVAFRGDYLPRHALCFCYSLRRWWIEEYPRPVGCSVLGASGRVSHGWGSKAEQLYAGSDAGEIFAFQQARPDIAAASASTPYTVISGGIETVTVSGTPTADMVGAPLVLRKQAQAAVQSRRIVAVSGNEIQVTPPWLSAPAAGDEAVVGGFLWQMRTDDFRMVAGEATGERSVEVFFDRNKGQKFDIELAYDYAADVVNAANIAASANFGVEYKASRTAIRVDMAKREAFAIIRLDGLREGMTDGPRTVRVKLTGIGGKDRDAIVQLVIKGTAS